MEIRTFPGLRAAMLSLLAGLVLAASAALATSCVVGAPPGFSDGDLWSVPLVAPLENDVFLVPVKIDGKGPFLFMIDPDSPESSIEASLQRSLGLYTEGIAKRQRLTEDDHLTYILLAEIKKLSIGDLDVKRVYARVQDDGTYWSGGRRVRGIIGHDIISDSLAFKFDRDQGMMYIGTQGHISAPPESQKIGFTQSFGDNHRFLAKASLNGKHSLSMHLDLGARTSMLWQHLLDKFKMPALRVNADQVDEYGSRRKITNGAIAGLLNVGEAQANALVMLPYADKRIDKQDFDGIVGQDFWHKFNITVNWHKKTFWLQKRNPDLTANAQVRVGRWGDQLTSCKSLACLTLSLEASKSASPGPVSVTLPTGSPAANRAPPTAAATDVGGPTSRSTQPTAAQSYTLIVDRSAPGTNFAYDALIGAVDSQGALLDLPVFLASFASGVSSLELVGLAPDYAAAAGFVVLDINPVGTRGCEGTQCIFPLKNPQ